MTTAVAISKTDLDEVFDEVEDAQADVSAKRRAVQTAEDQAGAAKGLTAAAQRDLQNSKARLQVLQLGQAEAESNDPQYAKLVQQAQAARDEYTEADRQATAVKQARAALVEINTALGQWVTKAKQATAAFASSTNDVLSLPVADTIMTQRRTVADALQQQGTSLDSELDQLGEPQKQRLSDADRQLAQLALSPKELGALKRKMTQLEGQRDKAQPKQEKAPDPDELKKVQAGYEAAQAAVDQAPEVERDSQAKLRLARENLAAAEDRRTAALVAKNEAEQRLIEGIDLIGPGADGSVTGKAKLRNETPPDGYSLEWTFDGVPVASDKDGNIRFDTKGMASGSYAITVHLHRDKATE
jgi:chromosome segregation ATPase